MTTRYTYILLFLWACMIFHCNPNQKLIQSNSPCPPSPDITISALQATSAQLSFQADPSVAQYKVSLKNIENNTTNTFFLAPQGNLNVQHQLTGLIAGNTYSIRVQTVCPPPNPNSPYPYQAAANPSHTEFFSTNATSVCAGVSNFDLYEINHDTISFSFQLPNNVLNEVKLFLINGQGNVAFSYVVPIYTANWGYYQVKTSLPAGDYTAWLESKCNNGNTYPSNIGIFSVTTGGGGPIVVTDDEIDAFKNPSYPTSLLHLPDYYSTSNCIPAHSETFLNIPVPKQLLVGYYIPFNIDNTCAPLNATYSRIKSYRVFAPQMNGLSGKYRISFPPIKCICANQNYKLTVLANKDFLVLPSGFTQNCGGCN